MADTVWVVRHGERQDTVDPNWEENADRIHDPGLTELGRWAAWRVGRRFVESGVGFDAIYASPFLRTVETADEICRELGTQASLEAGLGEHRNEEWFDADPETVPPSRLAEWFDTVRLNHDSVVVPEFPESHTEAMERAGETARRIANIEAGTVLLVGHGLTVGGVVQGLVGTADDVEAPLCGLTKMTRDGEGWRLDFSGDTSHLDQ